LVRSEFLAKKIKRSVLSKVTDFFSKSKYHAYLVGGYVRDLTLGREPVDIDIVVEGDAIEAAKKLNTKLNGKLSIHKEFGTASIITTHGLIDLASARIEKYPSPAMLPHVYPSTIIEDLNRRDFTMNAIAMSIAKENFGEIFDPFNGSDDIKKGTIRVLQKNSFMDDPTRIFRALRYKNRFGFKLEAKTEEQMEEAIAQNMIRQLSAQRIFNELRLIFEELTYQNTIQDISKLGIFKIKHRDLETLPRFDRLRIYFYISKLTAINFPLSKMEQKLVHDINRIDKIVAQLLKTSKNSMIYNILSPIDEQVRNLIPSLYPELENKIRIFNRIENIKPFIDGSDLKDLGFKPNRQFKHLLKRMFDLQIDKKIVMRKQALELLKNI